MAAEISPRKARMPIRWLLIISALFYGPAIFFKIQGDVVTASLLTIAGFAGFAGYRTGAISIVLLIASATAAFWIAPTVGISQEARFSSWFGTTGLTNRVCSIVAIGVGMMAIGSLLSWILRSSLRSRPRLESTNRWLGFAFGAAEGTMAVALFLGGMLMVEPRVRERAASRDPNDDRGLWASNLILQTSERTRQSLAGGVIAKHNPFEWIPQLNRFDEIQDTVEALKDPNKIQSIMYHPSIRELQRSPEVRAAVDELNADPEFANLLRSEQVDRTMAMQLMSHPAILKLVDDPEFVQRAGKIIHDLRSN